MGAYSVDVRMADAGGGGQGAYPPPLNVNAIAVAIAIVAPQVLAESRFNVALDLLGTVPTKSNSSCALHSSLQNN